MTEKIYKREEDRNKHRLENEMENCVKIAAEIDETLKIMKIYKDYSILYLS